MTRIRRFSFTARLTVVSLLTAASMLVLIGVQHVEGQKRGGAGARNPGVRSEMLVSTDWLSGRLNDPKVVVLHIARERAHYDKGHVPGARFRGLG